jgi:hypothetical protein
MDSDAADTDAVSWETTLRALLPNVNVTVSHAPVRMDPAAAAAAAAVATAPPPPVWGYNWAPQQALWGGGGGSGGWGAPFFYPQMVPQQPAYGADEPADARSSLPPGTRPPPRCGHGC